MDWDEILLAPVGVARAHWTCAR